MEKTSNNDKIIKLTNQVNKIRNIGIIGSFQSGKTTLCDWIINQAGLIDNKRIGTKYLDSRQLEQSKGFSIKSSPISINLDINNEDYLINLIDTPGNAAFIHETISSFNIIDGVLIVIDITEGVTSNLELVLTKCIQESIIPIIFFNKLDKAFESENLDLEKIYSNITRIIEHMNDIFKCFADSDFISEISALKNNILFGSSEYGWAFNLNRFTELYSHNYDMDKDAFINMLWGDHSFTDNKFKQESINTNNSDSRSFNKFILEPLFKLLKSLHFNNKEEYSKLFNTLNIKIDLEIENLDPKDRIKQVMQRWLSISDILLKTIVVQIPNPIIAQKYRIEKLYTGNLNDDNAIAMKKCDKDSPLIIFISKLIQLKDTHKLLAFGRIFSGTLDKNSQVKILGPSFKLGAHKDFYSKNIDNLSILQGSELIELSSLVAGNLVVIQDIEKMIIKQATIIDASNTTANLIKTTHINIPAVIKTIMEPKIAVELPKLIEAINFVNKIDVGMHIINEETFISLACCNSLHMEILLNEIYNHSKVEIMETNIDNIYKETVTQQSSQVSLCKSPNKHNRIYSAAEPLDAKLTMDIESGNVNARDDIFKTYKALVENYGWDELDARNIWRFGPYESGPNLLVNLTKSVEYINENKDHFEVAFDWVTREGILAEEPMRGIRFNILDLELRADAVHRGGGQMIPTARRSYYACQLLSEPRFTQAYYITDIVLPIKHKQTIENYLESKRGYVINENLSFNNDFSTLKINLPVIETNGFEKFLSDLNITDKQIEYLFDKWELIASDPFQTNSDAYNILMDIRKRKGLRQELPILQDYIDKL